MPNPLDFFAFEDLLTEEERAARDSVRRFVEAKVRPHVAQAWRDAAPLPIMRELAELGLFGATLDLGDGPTLNYVAYGLCMRELERADSCVRSMVGVQSNLCMYPIFTFGSAQHKEELLPQLAAGTLVGCFGLSEPDAGSDPGNMSTRATKVDGGWRISGTKRWITNGTLADIAIVWARTGQGASSIRGFVVPTDADGFSRHKLDGKQSFRASDTAELMLDDVFVPDEALLPGTDGLKSALAVLNQGRYGICWGVLGAAEDCFATALDFAKERMAFGRPIAGFQLVQQKFAQMSARLTHAQLLAWRFGRLKDEAVEKGGDIEGARTSMAKMANVETALHIARTCRDILGGNGIMDEYGIMRHMSNLETVYTYEGTHDVHQLVVGHALTGQSAFR